MAAASRLPPRLQALPEYAFPRLRALLGEDPPGKDMIDFSIGEPKHALPDMARAALDRHFEAFSRYPPVDGTEAWRASVTDWATRRYQLPEGWLSAQGAKAIPLSGTREGLFMAVIANCPETKAGQRPVVALPNPFYQCYAAAALAAQAEPAYLSATARTGWLPDLDQPDAFWERVAIFFLCSPSNPQGAAADAAYWSRLLALAERHDFLVFADECYSEIYRSRAPDGVLTAAAAGPGADRVIAFHSLSKRSNLAGLRSGFALGGAAPIAGLQRMKAYAGAPVPVPVLEASAELWRDEAHVAENRALYARKFEIADELFTNWPPYQSPEAGFFLWLPVGDGETVAKALWRSEGLKVLPGAYLSRMDAEGCDPGAEYIRVALVERDIGRVTEGLTRLRGHLERLAT